MFGKPTSALEAVAAAAVADRIGHDAPPFWALEEHVIGVHPQDPEWAYFIVRVPVTLTEIAERLRMVDHQSWEAEG